MLRFIITIALKILLTVAATAQPAAGIQTKSLEPYHLFIGYNKTSNLIFPYAIKSVDRGNQVILAQKPKGVENILQLKADVQGFEQTNLSVVTADGRFYSFLLDYAAEPAVLNLYLVKDTLSTQPAQLSGLALDAETFLLTKDSILGQKKFLHRGVTTQLMTLKFTRLYLTPQAMWFGVRITNRSLIDYVPDYFRFYLLDRKRSKRTARQETAITPLYSNAGDIAPGNSTQQYVFAFVPFTVPSSKELVILVSEKNGGRTLELHIPYRLILKARKLS